MTLAYHQIEVEEDSKKYLTVNIHKGLYQYKRLPFGIKMASAIWQHTIEQVLQGIPGTEVLLDVIVVTGRTTEEHVSRLDMVLKRLQKKNLRVNTEKCYFFQEQIEYCGHVIDKRTSQDAEKIDAIINAPRPTNVSTLCAYLGLVNYYHRFLPNIATVLRPLNELLEKDKVWQWSISCETAFLKSKELVASDLVLTHYEPSLNLKVECDASPYGLGAVLSHVMPDNSENPIAFASRSLSKAERNY